MSGDNLMLKNQRVIWKRLAAYTIDCAIILLFVILLDLLLFIAFTLAYGEQTDRNVGEGLLLMLLNLVTLVVLHFVYFPISESSSRMASPGKQIMRLIVTDCSHTRISYVRALARSSAISLSILVPLGALMTVFTKRGQALHDLMANCLVSERVDNCPNQDLS